MKWKVLLLGVVVILTLYLKDNTKQGRQMISLTLNSMLFLETIILYQRVVNGTFIIKSY